MAKKKATAPDRPLDLSTLPRMAGGPAFPLARGVALVNLHGVYERHLGDDGFFVIAHGALDAGGLIGWERNGITIAWANRGLVCLEAHARGPSHPLGQVSPRQVAEYDRICQLDAQAFCAFVNNHPDVRHPIMATVSRKSPSARLVPIPTVDPAAFTATEFATVYDKAKSLRALLKFAASGFPEAQWTRRLYDTLSQHFGHIAHYNQRGFWDEWFAAPPRQVAFLWRHREEAIYGSPTHTWSDVRRVFQQWLRTGDGAKLITLLEGRLQDKVRQRELLILEQLAAKYPEDAARLVAAAV